MVFSLARHALNDLCHSRTKPCFSALFHIILKTPHAKFDLGQTKGGLTSPPKSKANPARMP